MMGNYRPFAGTLPAVRILITVNVVVYLFSAFASRSVNADMTHLLGLHLPQSHYWAPWQYVTHMFMHGGIGHLFFNMFALFMFGRVLEVVWGSRRFILFYFVCGIGAGLLNSLVGWFEIHRLVEQYAVFKESPDPQLLAEFVKKQINNPADWVWTVIDNWINHPTSNEYIQAGKQLFQQVIDSKINVSTVGASGAVFGILLGFGMLFPNTELFLMFLPIPIKAKYFVLGYGVLELFLGMQNSASDNVAHFAHLGGMLFGFILIKYWSRNRRKFY